MTDAVLVAGIAAVSSTLGAIVGLFNNRTATKIHVLVNSNYTALQAEMGLATKRIAALQMLVGKLDITVTAPEGVQIPSSVLVDIAQAVAPAASPAKVPSP
jgi:hypothetical protein